MLLLSEVTFNIILSGFPTTAVYAFLIYPMHDTFSARLILQDLFSLTILGEGCAAFCCFLFGPSMP
jgi:hypothetical protein